MTNNMMSNNKKRKNVNNNRNKQNALTVARLSGKGDYKSTLQQIKNTLGPIMKPLVKKALVQGGGALGGMASGYLVGNSKMGNSFGSSLGAKISKLIGSGDYISNDGTRSNSLMKGGGDPYASFDSSKKGVRITHREFLQDVISPGTTFNIESYPINPGLPFSFPYLANIALNFEEYRVNGLVYEFISTATPYSTVSNMGSVIVTCEYNTANNDYTSKTQMENSDFAVSGAPYRNLVYGVECEKNWSNNLFVRSGASTLNGPLTDLGTFFIATNAVQAGTIGELWVSYDIEFSRPRASPARFGIYHAISQGTAVTIPIIGTAAGISTKVQTGIFTSAVASTFNTISFPDAIIGDIYCVQVMVNAGTTIVTNVIPSYTGFALFNCLDNNSTALESAVQTTAAMYNLFLQVTNFNPTLVLNGAVQTTSSGYYSDMLILCAGSGYRVTEV